MYVFRHVCITVTVKVSVTGYLSYQHPMKENAQPISTLRKFSSCPASRLGVDRIEGTGIRAPNSSGPKPPFTQVLLSCYAQTSVIALFGILMAGKSFLSLTHTTVRRSRLCPSSYSFIHFHLFLSTCKNKERDL